MYSLESKGPAMTVRALAEQYVKRWFCHENEILWERGGHYKEETAALLTLLQAREQAVWEEAANMALGQLTALKHNPDNMIHNAACYAIEKQCRARAKGDE